MPYKCEKIILPENLDRRIKLSEAQKQEIRNLKHEHSQRALAKMYDVSRRLIQFILDPEKLSNNLKAREERGGSKIYYDKDKHTEAMRDHRQYKHALYKSGEISLP